MMLNMMYQDPNEDEDTRNKKMAYERIAARLMGADFEGRPHWVAPSEWIGGSDHFSRTRNVRSNAILLTTPEWTPLFAAQLVLLPIMATSYMTIAAGSKKYDLADDFYEQFLLKYSDLLMPGYKQSADSFIKTYVPGGASPSDSLVTVTPGEAAVLRSMHEKTGMELFKVESSKEGKGLRAERGAQLALRNVPVVGKAFTSALTDAIAVTDLATNEEATDAAIQTMMFVVGPEFGFGAYPKDAADEVGRIHRTQEQAVKHAKTVSKRSDPEAE